MKEGKCCEWCGTNLRGGTTCPRGPSCAQEEANHLALMEEIERERDGTYQE